MIFNKKENKDPINPDNNNDLKSEYPNFIEENMEELPSSNYSEENQRKRGFYSAIQGKGLNEVLNEVSSWFTKQTELKNVATNMRISYVEEQLNQIKVKIEEEKKKFTQVEIIENELIVEKTKHEETISKLDIKFQDLINSLGNAHKNLVEDRLKEVKNELNELVNIYKDIFDNKLGHETELKTSVVQHRNLCDQLIEKNKKIYDTLSEKLEQIYLFGSSKISASFLLSVGLLSAVASGWFFAIFSDFNDLENQNWLFFTLNNTINYLSLYIQEYGQFNAGKGMVLYFLAILLITSTVIYISQLFLYKMTNDRSDVQFGVNLSPQQKHFFKLKIKSNSTLSFWFQILPWVFGLGILFIVLAVGQSLGTETEQIGQLGERLSSQLIGSTIALLCTGLFFLYVVKIIEPRKVAESTQATPHKKRGNRELIILVIVANIFLALITLSQTFDNLLEDRNSLLAIFCFVLLVNLTAFTLSYGIRQNGMIKTCNEAEEKMRYLSNFKKALSGSTPIHLWIQEERQFQRNFLSIQQELFNLIKIKNNSLNQNTKPGFFRIFTSPKNGLINLGKLNLARKKEAQFYSRNFPALTNQIEEIRNQLNAEKRLSDELKVKITALRDGYSDFHNKINEELRRLKYTSYSLLRQRTEIESDKLTFHQKLEEQQLSIQQEVSEGYELGTWTKKTIMN